MKSLTNEKKWYSVFSWIEKRKEIFFLVIFALWYTLDYFYSLNLGKYEIGKNTYYLKILRPIKYLMVLIAVITNRGTVRNFVLRLIVAVFLYITARKSLFFDLFYAWIILWASENVDFTKTVKITAIMLGLYLPLTYLACRLGILDEVYGIFRYDIERKSFGFQHPNHMAFRVFSLVICLCYLLKDRKSVFIYLFSAGSIFILWNFQNSRASCGCILIMIVLFAFRSCFFHMNSYSQRFILYTFSAGVLLLNVLMIVLTLTYDKNTEIYQMIDSFTSHRIIFGNEAFLENGLSVFGQRIFLTMSERKSVGLEGQIIVDCAYVNILLRGGIVTYIGFTFAYIYGMIKSVKKNDYLKVCIMFVMALFGVSELEIYQASANIFLMLLPMYVDRAQVNDFKTRIA